MAHHGRLEAIWRKRAGRGPMDACDQALFVAARGISGNADQGGKRQVTIISLERWQKLGQEVGGVLEPSVRRANLMVSGIDLENSRKRILKIGNCRLPIHGETRPCERTEEARAGLQAAMRHHWGGDAFAEVLDSGEIKVGDQVSWVTD